MSLLRLKSRGNEVRKLQTELNKRGINVGSADGIFGTRTFNGVKAFQKANKLSQDGIVGPATRKVLYANLIENKDLQSILDRLGIKNIREFQRIFKLSVDGIAGKNTWRVLNKLRNVRHFKANEFACRHCKVSKLDPDLLVKLEELRRVVGNRPISITSGYRCSVHNRNVGGASKSQHLYGKAVDIQVRGMSPNNVYTHANRVFSRGGVGKYRTFTHVDVRGHKTRW